MATSLKGIWQPTAAELGGEEAPAMVLTRMELEFTAETYTVRFGGVAADQGRYVVDDGGITLTGVTGPNEGRTIPCLVRLDENGLTICFGLGGVRPTAFATAGDPQRYLVSYRRRAD